MEHLAIHHADGLAAEVHAEFVRGAWRYRVTFRDLESDSIIDNRTYADRASAIAWADRVVSGSAPSSVAV